MQRAVPLLRSMVRRRSPCRHHLRIKRAVRGGRASFLSSSFSTSNTDANHCYIHEVTPRDGIQNEKVVLDLATKVDLVRRLVATSPSSIEVGSFVRGDLVPAMAHSAELCQQLQNSDWAQQAHQGGMEFAVLIPNLRGYHMFHEVGKEVELFGRSPQHSNLWNILFAWYL